MEFKYVMTPAGKGAKNDVEAATKACRYFRMDDVPIRYPGSRMIRTA